MEHLLETGRLLEHLRYYSPSPNFLCNFCSNFEKIFFNKKNKKIKQNFRPKVQVEKNLYLNLARAFIVTNPKI